MKFEWDEEKNAANKEKQKTDMLQLVWSEKFCLLFLLSEEILFV